MTDKPLRVVVTHPTVIGVVPFPMLISNKNLASFTLHVAKEIIKTVDERSGSSEELLHCNSRCLETLTVREGTDKLAKILDDTLFHIHISAVKTAIKIKIDISTWGRCTNRCKAKNLQKGQTNSVTI